MRLSRFCPTATAGPRPVIEFDLSGRQALGAAAQGVDLEEAAASFVVEGVEDEGGLAGAGDARDDGQAIVEVEVEVLEVVLAGAADGDGHGRILTGCKGFLILDFRLLIGKNFHHKVREGHKG